MHPNEKIILEYIQFVKGHKNSKGEPAPWVIKSHKTDKILSSHKTEKEAKEHLKHMHVFGEKEEKEEDSIECPEKSTINGLMEKWIEKYLRELSTN